jgi:hypothetical protein
MSISITMQSLPVTSPAIAPKQALHPFREYMRLLQFERFCYFFAELGGERILPAEYRNPHRVDAIGVYAVFGGFYHLGVVAQAQIVL